MKSFIRLLLLAASVAFSLPAKASDVNSALTSSEIIAIIGDPLLKSGGTMAGTLTLADGATWASTGLAQAATITTVSTAAISYAPVWSFSSTSNGISALSFSPALTPTGASAGNVNGTSIGTTVGTSAVNGGAFRGASVSLTASAGYSGTLTEMNGLLVSLTNSGTNASATAKTLMLNAPTNGNGITTGTVNNYVAYTNPGTIAAGSGGTVNNHGLMILLGSGSGAGTTTNYGLRITGNGGSGGAGTTTNYAIYSESTALSSFAGPIAIGNTVNSVSPTSPNRTVTMVIGGTTYYLAAKTTND